MCDEQKNEKQFVQTGTANNPNATPATGNIPQTPIANEPLRFEINIPKSADNGEDAPPILADLDVSIDGTQDTKSVLLGVFDGMGGAGSQKIIVDNKGTQKTNAYVGSRAARELTLNFFETGRVQQTGIEQIEQNLKEHIKKGLKAHSTYFDTTYPQLTSKLVSSLHKKLPTTMALIWYQNVVENNTLQLITLWAGDSRCYALSPQKGLLQLTKDDNGIADAMIALTDSPQMNNSLSASQDFRINRKDYAIDQPCMLFAASDGVFDYLPSPILLEYTILNTLQESNSITEWKNRLQEILDIWKQDDVSMALSLPGLKDFKEVQTVFLERFEYLRTTYNTMTDNFDKCTESMKRKKALTTNIAEYTEEKNKIDVSIIDIDGELQQLSQKMKDIVRLISEYKRQIELLETQIRTEESNTSNYTQEIGDKKMEKSIMEEEKIPWEEKISQANHSIDELGIDRLLNDLRKEAREKWHGYKSCYEGMLNSPITQEHLSPESDDNNSLEQ